MNSTECYSERRTPEHSTVGGYGMLGSRIFQTLSCVMQVLVAVAYIICIVFAGMLLNESVSEAGQVVPDTLCAGA
jgi:uncharacterized membrane protein